MPTYLPSILICTEAVKDDIDAIIDAQGRGDNTMSRALCAIDGGATYETTPTHRLAQDMSATPALEVEWKALALTADLPSIAGVWGEDGVIAAATAQSAVSGGKFKVFSAAGLVTTQDATDWRDGILAGLGLQFVPDAPL